MSQNRHLNSNKSTVPPPNPTALWVIVRQRYLFVDPFVCRVSKSNGLEIFGTPCNTLLHCTVPWKVLSNIISKLGLEFGVALSLRSVILTDRKKTVHFWAALHFYSIANFVVLWLNWLQMTSLNLLDTRRLLLESFKSKGNKSNALKNCPVLFFVPSWR